MHVLVVGQHGVGLSVEEVDVPDAQQSQQDGSVLLQRSGAEVVVLQERKGGECTSVCSSCFCSRKAGVDRFSTLGSPTEGVGEALTIQ